MKILTTSNHGNTFNPKEGADIRKYHLLMELSKKNNLFFLESDRYKHDKDKVPSDINGDYFHEISIRDNPLSFLMDLNPSYIYKLFNLLKHKNYDIVQISFCYGITITKLIVLLFNNKTKIIYDAHNVEGDYVFQVSDKMHGLFEKYFYRLCVPAIEKLAVTTANHIICVSESDKLRFIEKYKLPLDKITVIPSGTEIRSLKSKKSLDEKFRHFFNIKDNEVVILFHGTYNYPPNREAIDLIIEYIAPQIKNQFENVVFLLAGNGVPIFEKDNVKSVGFVEKLESLLYVSDIAIVPILKGGGTRLKILDYMSVGLPIVSTKKGIEGIEVIEGKDAIVCEDVNEHFLERLLYLLANDEIRINIGKNAYELAKNQYDWKKIGDNLNDAYANLVSK